MIDAFRGAFSVLGLRNAAVACVLAACAVAPTSADVVILSSSAPALERGAVIADGAALTLGDNEIVRIMAANGSTRELAGPFTGRVGDLPGAQSAPVEAFQRAVRVLSGALRYDRAALASRGADILLNGAAYERDGAFCFARAGSISIARRDASAAARLEIRTLGFDPVVVELAPGEPVARFRPDEVFPRDGARYSIIFEPGGSLQVVARATPAEALAGDFAARTLLAEGCEQQFLQFLERPL